MKKFAIVGLSCLVLIVCSCGKYSNCLYYTGDARFQVDPNSAATPGLNTVWGYEYFTGGHRGVVVIRTAYNEFLAFERTCTCDSNSAVVVSHDWGTQILECPLCGSLYSVNNYGYPVDDSENNNTTQCPLYQYSTRFNGGTLYVY